jgi:hypothetical protein
MLLPQYVGKSVQSDEEHFNIYVVAIMPPSGKRRHLKVMKAKQELNERLSSSLADSILSTRQWALRKKGNSSQHSFVGRQIIHCWQ